MSLKSMLPGFEGMSSDGFTENDPGSRNKAPYLKPGTPTYNPEEGKPMHIRFMPIYNERYFAKEVPFHFEIAGIKAFAICPTYFKLPCAACDRRKKLLAEEKKELAQNYKTSFYHLAYVIDRKNEDKGPLVWPISNKAIQTIRACFTHPKTGALLVVDDVDEGYDIFFKKAKAAEGEKFAQVGAVQRDTDCSPLHSNPEKALEWMKYVKDNGLTTLLIQTTSDQIREMVEGGGTKSSAPSQEPTSTIAKELVADAPPTSSKASEANDYDAKMLEFQAKIDAYKKES